MTNTPTTEPATITAGDTVTWLISLADYPASAGWVLKYALVCATGALAISSSAADDDHLITLTAATTGAYPAGTYKVQKYVEKGTGSSLQRFTLAAPGPLTVQPSLIGATATDTRSKVKIILDAIDASIAKRATKAQQEIIIDGTRIVKMAPEQLRSWRNAYALMYWREQNPGKLAPQVNISFGGR